MVKLRFVEPISRVRFSLAAQILSDAPVTCYHRQMKSLFLGMLVIVIVGIGGLVYRNAIEHPSQPIACPLDAKICPDGTSVARTGTACVFAECPPPNTRIEGLGIAFALPSGFTWVANGTPDDYVYEGSKPSPESDATASIEIQRYLIDASSTPLATIKENAVSGTSGKPINPTSFTSTVIGSHRFTVVTIERFEGTIDTAYYLAREKDVLRFDAIDMGTDWTNSSLAVSALPAHAALLKLLATLQGE